ncbi:unnamed protein product [Blepharisma stoltei]|uniref:Uncharacterized protein n=1 Tax=Blepharisma stoltei TaxID=1481888 RepID=A0AAU9JJ39_9CILI|nr:unnamed protein product [Blepharisma stoltei]
MLQSMIASRSIASKNGIFLPFLNCLRAIFKVKGQEAFISFKVSLAKPVLILWSFSIISSIDPGFLKASFISSLWLKYLDFSLSGIEENFSIDSFIDSAVFKSVQNSDNLSDSI